MDTPENMQVLSASRDEIVLLDLEIIKLTNLECCNHMIRSKKKQLNTPEKHAALKDPPKSIQEYFRIITLNCMNSVTKVIVAF